MNTYFYRTVKDTIVCRDYYLANVDAQLVGHYFCKVEQQSLTVDAANTYRSVEEQLLVHVPFRVENTIAESCLKLRCYRTCPLMYLYATLVVDISQSVIARDRVTAWREDILVDGLFGYEYRLLFVEVFSYDEQVL